MHVNNKFRFFIIIFPVGIFSLQFLAMSFFKNLHFVQKFYSGEGKGSDDEYNEGTPQEMPRIYHIH